MTHFKNAFQSWCSRYPDLNLADIADDADLNRSLVYQYRKSDGRNITIDALDKLLPAIEKHTSLNEALTLHIAYLHDETVAKYRQKIAITTTEVMDHVGLDELQVRAKRWVDKSRKEPDFELMWRISDQYMHDPAALIAQQPPQSRAGQYPLSLEPDQAPGLRAADAAD